MINQDIIHDTQGIGWEALQEFPGPVEGKILRDEKELGAKTMLVRVPAGAEITPHSHRGIVQHFILEGQYEAAGQLFESGSYRMMPEHCNVSPISTKDGVTILMIYDPVSK